MAPGFREDSYMIVQPGSLNTLVKFGLDDPLGLPSHCIPTKIYKNNDTDYSITPKVGYNELFPIVKGEIVDIEGLKFFIQSIIQSVLDSSVEEGEISMPLDSVNLLIVQTSTRWNPFLIESLVNYGFETLNVHSISIVPIESCILFSHGSIANSLVIDIGYEKTEILPIVDYQLYAPSKKVIEKGGSLINHTLKKFLPSFNDEQIEILKKSPIFECLSEEDAKKSFYGMDGLIENIKDIEDNDKEDDGILDIAAIVTSDKSTRELLDETKNKKNKKKEVLKSNSELETNTFYDSNGNLISVGKERFQGCNELIDSIVLNIYHSLKKIPDLRKRQDCYDNIIITGQTSKIKGLKEKIIFGLFSNYVIISDDKLLQPQSQFRNDVRPIDDNSITQVPRHLKIVPKVDYFSEWKKNGFEDCSFLGAQILSKQVFTSNNDLCLTKETYNESGPMSIWNICL